MILVYVPKRLIQHKIPSLKIPLQPLVGLASLQSSCLSFLPTPPRGALLPFTHCYVSKYTQLLFIMCFWCPCPHASHLYSVWLFQKVRQQDGVSASNCTAVIIDTIGTQSFIGLSHPNSPHFPFSQFLYELLSAFLLSYQPKGESLKIRVVQYKYIDTNILRMRKFFSKKNYASTLYIITMYVFFTVYSFFFKKHTVHQRMAKSIQK